jgi:hypothetical protein
MALLATMATGVTGCARSMDKPPRCSGSYYPLNSPDHYVVPGAKDTSR